MMTHARATPITAARSASFRVAAWGALAVIVSLFAATAWVGVRAFIAKGELESAIPLASKIQSQVVSGNGAKAGLTSEKLSARAAKAVALTSDPVWRAFEVLPVLGPNLTAVREIAAVVDAVSQDAVEPLSEVAAEINLSEFRPADGSIDVQPLVDAQEKIAAATLALHAARRQVASIDTSTTFSVVEEATGRLDSEVIKAAEGLGALDRAVRLVPTMLGASGPRNYVLLFQNPAELRATGGIAGAVALVHTEEGRIELTQQASSSDFPHYESPVLNLPAETSGLYGNITGEYIQDVNLTPIFPLSAQLAREMWQREFGVKADGVISIDPVALSYILKATGPITLPTGDVLSADNAVQLLLSDVYDRYENPAHQDRFFAAAAASVFTAVSSGNADPAALLGALAKAGAEHRVLVWSAHEEDQAVLADTTLAGGLPISDTDAQRFGVYLNDATGAKMDMYLDLGVAVGQATCRQDKRPTYGVEVTLSNTASTEAGKTLPAFVTGGGVFGVKPGNIKTMAVVYGVPGMQNLGMTRDGEAVGYHPATDSTYPVSSVSVELAPGESTVLRFDWLGSEPFTGGLEAQSTPVINLPVTQNLKIACEPRIG